MESVIQNFLISLAVGTLGRFYLLRVDYRQYPSYPRGVIMHLAFGVIAASLGSIALPALLAKDYAAVTFLALAAEQFRSIRGIERENLSNIEELEIVKRGSSYIEEIAKIFEARNYIVVLASLSTSAALHIFKRDIAFLFGVIVLVILKSAMKGQKINDIANVRIATVKFKNALLYVDNINIMNVGLTDIKEKILKNAVGVILEPKDENASIAMSNMGQRQAIIHDVVAQLGIKKDVDEPEFTPLARRDMETGNIGIVFYPSIQDKQALIKAIEKSPVLESTARKPSESKVNY